jgi:hypothetical protein
MHVPTGAITLGDLQVGSICCSVAKLIACHGPDAGLPDFKDSITTDCPCDPSRRYGTCAGPTSPTWLRWMAED